MKRRYSGRKLVIQGILLLFIWAVFPFFNFAADASIGNLMGFVYDKDGKTPLEEASVLLKKVNSKKGKNEYRSAPTGETGDYKLSDIPVGKYKVAIVVKSGKIYRTLSVVNIIGGKTVIRSFHLAPQRPFLAFFYEPCGLAMTIAGTALVIKIIKKEESKTEL